MTEEILWCGVYGCVQRAIARIIGDQRQSEKKTHQ